MGEHFREKEDKITLGMIVAGVGIIAILITSLVVYLLSTEDKNTGEVKLGETNTNTITNSSYESTSIGIGKTINEVQNEMNSTSIENFVQSNVIEKDASVTEKDTETNIETNNFSEEETKETSTEAENAMPEEINFIAPIKGEIITDFAPDSLVYSETLQEWITHKGVDIKADKTSVVVSSAKGVVSAIKNDPRYGLTVIVDHEGGYKTLYANLLTAEFVVEGETLEEGQTIGTIGNSATFEIADDYHLHFELIRDNECINPNNYIEF